MGRERDVSDFNRDTTARPRQLADADAVFVAVESPEAPSHIAGLTIVDPSGSPDFSFHRYVELLRERIAQIDRFRWKLFELPFGIDRAYWVEAEDFDLSDHVHRIALPAPGDRVALGELAGFLHSQVLDRSRPLWESWWIEGLEGGRVATLLKFHHSLMDGQSGIELSATLMDLSSEPPPCDAPYNAPNNAANNAPNNAAPRETPPRRPGIWEIARGALVHGLARPERVVVHAQRALRDGLSRTTEMDTRRNAPRVPHAHFNDRLSRHRGAAFASVPLGPVRDAKKHFNVTVNDVLLELVSSSLRYALGQRGELPEESIVALCPVSLRSDTDPSFGNQLSSMPVSLATNFADPVSRLIAIHESAEAAKRRLAGGAFETLTALGECFVPGALRAITRAAHAVPSLLPLPGNLVFSNVRGLPVPMYLAGARVEEMYPMSMLQVANGINITAVSHDDQVDFGFLVDSKLIPDPWIYADGIDRALVELETAVAHRSRVGVPYSPKPTGPARSPLAVRAPTTESNAPKKARSGAAGQSAATPTKGDAPLDLQLMIGQLSHLRAPPREGIRKSGVAEADSNTSDERIRRSPLA